METKKITVSSGCTQPRSIQMGNNVVYYVGNDGVYYLTTTTQDVVLVQSLSDKITPEFKNVVIKNSIYYHSNYFLLTNKGMLIFDERLNAWTKWDSRFNTVMLDDGLDQLVFGGNQGYFYSPDKSILYDEYAPDVKTAINGSFATPYLYFDMPEVTKRYKWFKLFYCPNDLVGSEINVRIDIDYSDQYKTVDSFYNSLVWEDDGTVKDNLW